MSGRAGRLSRKMPSSEGPLRVQESPYGRWADGIGMKARTARREEFRRDDHVVLPAVLRPPCHRPACLPAERAGVSTAHRSSNVEAKMHDVPFMHHILLTFEPEFADLFGTRLAFISDVVVVRDDLGTNKTLFEVGMNDARSLRCS